MMTILTIVGVIFGLLLLLVVAGALHHQKYTTLVKEAEALTNVATIATAMIEEQPQSKKVDPSKTLEQVNETYNKVMEAAMQIKTITPDHPMYEPLRTAGRNLWKAGHKLGMANQRLQTS